MNIEIVDYRAGAQCEMTGKEGECVVINSPEQQIEGSVISFQELIKMVRFRAKLEERNGRVGRSPASVARAGKHEGG
jgi:hypothetical protein